MTEPLVSEFRYELPRNVDGHRPGHHRSRTRGPGVECREVVPWSADPDSRRFDVLATCRQPHGEPMVRSYRERRAVPVIVIADLSASLRFVGTRRKLDVLAQFIAATALSAQRCGDAFGFLAAADTLIESLRLPPTRSRGWGELMAARVRDYPVGGTSAAGLLAAALEIGRPRSLVFLASDFHFPLALLERVLTALQRHTVVPVVLWDPAEQTLAPTRRWGITAVSDLESGQRRLVWWRPALRARVEDVFRERRRELEGICARQGLRPLFLLDGFDAARVTDYFLGLNASPSAAP